MNADQVRTLVAKQYPQAMQSPLAQAFGVVAARDEADAVIDFARLSVKCDVKARSGMRDAALEHALSCVEHCTARGVDYDEETISHNVESNFPDLNADVCDEIARAAIARKVAS